MIFFKLQQALENNYQESVNSEMEALKNLFTQFLQVTENKAMNNDRRMKEFARLT